MRIPEVAQKFEQENQQDIQDPQQDNPQQKSGKLPPMAAAIRTFVSGMDLPPRAEKRADYTMDYVAIIQAMLCHTRGLRPESTETICSPSQEQLIAVCRCSEKTLRRRLDELKVFGTLTIQKRPNESNIYTIHKQHLERSTVGLSTERSTNPSGPVNSEGGAVNNGLRSGQQLSPIGVLPIGVKPQDSSQDGERLWPSPSAGLRQPKESKPVHESNNERAHSPTKVDLSEKVTTAVAELDSRPWTKRSGMEKQREEWTRAISLFLGTLRCNVGMGLHVNMIDKEAADEGINLPNDVLYAVIQLLMDLKYVIRIKGTLFLAEYAPKGDRQ
jgi:hypothetical protein